MQKFVWVFLAAAMIAPPGAGESKLEVGVEIPQLNVSEYHRPYIAVWVQDPDDKVVTNLAVWYQLKTPTDKTGKKWLPDLRQWWRRSGRTLDVPVDGVTGPTKPAGFHELKFGKDDKQLANLKPGNYTLLVEASREVGGRELIEIDFTWPVQETKTFDANGKSELGKITLKVNP
ncbi:DUF2271 domain-containing protein [Lacunimicrobium album]